MSTTLEPEIVEEVETTSISINRDEIDMQIATANRFPRSLTQFKRDLEEMACLDKETAESMFYTLPRRNQDGTVKEISGPSARFAEMVGAAYGNMRYGGRVVDVGEKYVTAEGVCFDVQKNVTAVIQVQRRITNSSGRRYSDDMIVMTGNAATSIALRNAIFKVVPTALTKAALEKAKLCAVGEVRTTEQKRKAVLDWFGSFDVTESQLLRSLNRKGIDDLTTEDMVLLRGLATGAKDNEFNLQEALQEMQDAHEKEMDDVAEELARKHKDAAKKKDAPVDSGTSDDSEESDTDDEESSELTMEEDVEGMTVDEYYAQQIAEMQSPGFAATLAKMVKSDERLTAAKRKAIQSKIGSRKRQLEGVEDEPKREPAKAKSSGVSAYADRITKAKSTGELADIVAEFMADEKLEESQQNLLSAKASVAEGRLE